MYTLAAQLSESIAIDAIDYSVRVSRAGIGFGDVNLIWSAELGAGFLFKPWLGIAFRRRGTRHRHHPR